MRVLEALAAAIAAEGVDRIFAVIGDANQEIIVELCEKRRALCRLALYSSAVSAST